MLVKFELATGSKHSWPLKKSVLRDFAVFCICKKKLKAGSVRSYLAALSCLHRLRGWHDFEVKDTTINAILRGGTNLSLASGSFSSSTRRVMTIPLLRLLGHRLKKSGWSQLTTQAVWSCSLLAFFGTFRMGELLAPGSFTIDPACTLTWANMKLREDNSFLVHIRLPKMGTIEGEFVDIFPLPDKSLCPVEALRKHKQLQVEAGLGKKEDPVFALGQENYLTTRKFNEILRVVLTGVVDFKRDSISCHSFRAGLPSLISRHPDLMTSEDVKGWGRWSSEAYQRYTRLKFDQKKTIHNKIVEIIL